MESFNINRNTPQSREFVSFATYEHPFAEFLKLAAGNQGAKSVLVEVTWKEDAYSYS